MRFDVRSRDTYRINEMNVLASIRFLTVPA